MIDKLINKMLGKATSPGEQILRLPQPKRQENFLRMCTSQQIPKDFHNYDRIEKPNKQKISVKRLLKKKNGNIQQSIGISRASGRTIHEQKCSSPVQGLASKYSFLKSPPKFSSIQNHNAYNYIFGEYIIKPQQVRIIYQNKSPSKVEPTQAINQTNFNFVQPKIIGIQKQTNNPEGRSEPQPPKQEAKKNAKNETFNQFMSFGPKNLELLKDFDALNINEITSQIMEATERTEGPEARQLYKERTHTKTYTQINLKKEKEKFSASQLHYAPPKLDKSDFPKSSLFKSIKKTETMGRDDNSDHESEVVQKFESLMEKVRGNRLEHSLHQF